MLSTEVKLLIVDDEPAIRATLSSMFTTVGHSVRCAQDGFSALAALRAEIPDILLSDLNMPGMSGFEFLSVVRRRFPSIPVIAMSGAFSGEAVPLGVAADVFYRKGSGAGALLETVRGVARMQHSSVRHPLASAPIWISHTAQNPTGDNSVMMTCPECLRAFPEVVDGGSRTIREAGCAHCASVIHYAIVQPADDPSAQRLQRGRSLRARPSQGLDHPAACD